MSKMIFIMFCSKHFNLINITKMFPLPNKINKLKKLVVDLSHNSDISCNYEKKQQLAIKKKNKLAILKNKSEL